MPTISPQALMAQKGGLYADVEVKIVDDPARRPDGRSDSLQCRERSLLASARGDQP